MYWVVRKIHAAKDLNLINEIKNLNLLRFNFPSKLAQTFRTTQYVVIGVEIHFFDKSLNFVCKNSKLKNEFISPDLPYSAIYNYISHI